MSDDPAKTGVDAQKALDQVEDKQSKSEQEASTAATEYNKEIESDGKSMHVKVYSPFRDYYDGQAFSLSAENLTGPFDILPKHHNFISLLTPCEVTVRTVQDQQKPVKIRISGGILHVKADEVLVFLDV
jgi:phenylalanyl-tRNA synthetase alpha subunit